MGCTPVCDCKITFKNTGNDCQPLHQVAKKLIFVPTYKKDGTRNFVLLSATLNAAYFTALVNQADDSQRWYPLPQLKNIEDTRGEPIVEEFEDRSRIFVSEGTREFTGIMVGKDANLVLKDVIDSFRCADVSIYVVDKNGSLIGNISDDGTQLFPVQLDADSIIANFIKPTDTTAQKLELNFNYSPDESDACLRLVTAAEMPNANLLKLKGLVDVFAEYSDITATGAKVKLTTKFGTAKTPTVVTGLVTADFASADSGVASKVYNKTDDADITLSSATESGVEPGLYTLVWTPAQTSTDVMVVFVKKNGFDATDLKSDEVTIP